MVASASVLAGLLSLLTSVAGLPEVKADEEIKRLESKEYADEYEDEEE